MKKLTNKEVLTLALALVSLLASVVAAILQIDSLYRVSILIFFGILVACVVLILVRLDKIARQQTTSRREVYQVLYSLHGTKKMLLEQSEELQKIQAEQNESLRKLSPKEIEKSLQRGMGGSPGTAAENVKKLLQRNNNKIDNAVEAQRIQMNRLFAVLDAHWDKLSNE